MKSKNIIIWMLALVLVVLYLGPAQVGAAVIFDDGETHNIPGSIISFGQYAFDSSNFPLSNVVAVAAGFGHSLALKSDGSIVGSGIQSPSSTQRLGLHDPGHLRGVVHCFRFATGNGPIIHDRTSA